MFWKIPPRIKVLEALTCIADGKIEIKNNKARVVSSLGDREYTVIYDEKKNAIFSNDNGSIYRGYLGYPAIAFLMVKGKLPYNEKIAKALRDIKWRLLNEKYKKYFVVEKIVKNIAKKRGVDEEEINKFIEKVLDEIKKLKIKKLNVHDIQAWT